MSGRNKKYDGYQTDHLKRKKPENLAFADLNELNEQYGGGNVSISGKWTFFDKSNA